MKDTVIILSQYLYPDKTGGMEIFNSFLIRELRREFSDLKIRTISYSRESNEDHISLIKSFFGIRRFGLGQLSLAIQLIGILAWNRKKIKCLVINYTSNSQHYSKYIPFICSKLKLKYILTIHGGGLGKWENQGSMKKFFEQANEVIAVSPTIKKHYEALVNREIIYIPPSLPFFDYAVHDPDNRLSNDSLNILFAGSLKEIKGITTLVHAFLGLDLQYVKENKLVLCILGDGPLMAELANLIGQSGLQDHVYLAGRVNFEKVQSYYEKANIFVIPSKYEGTSISMLQAMANSLPVIGSDVNGINNIITNGNNGLLFPYLDELALMRQLRKCIENKSLREEIGKKGHETYLQEYAFGFVLNKYKHILYK